jgi:glycosyltransferase involved in cell wall biosynthesis
MSVGVTFVSSHAQPGGSERYLSTLLAELGPPWIRAVVVLEEGPFVAELRAQGLSPTVIPTSGGRLSILRAGSRLRRALAKDPPDVIHANGIKAALITVLATRRSQIPIVWLKHDVSHDGRLARWVAARCGRVVGVSSFVMRMFEAANDERRYRVVYTGLSAPSIEREVGRTKVLDTLGAPEPVSVVGMVARLDPFKGHRELIGAAPAILERHPNTRFLIVGGEDHSHQGWEALLREIVTRSELAHAITFTGHRDDARALMAGFDIGVIPSTPNHRGMGREGFSLVGLEYLACGTPLVAYDAGGLPELAGECAVLVPEKNRHALADAISSLIGDAEKRRHLATCGKERVNTRFRLEQMVTTLSDIYKEVAG